MSIIECEHYAPKQLCSKLVRMTVQTRVALTISGALLSSRDSHAHVHDVSRFQHFGTLLCVLEPVMTFSLSGQIARVAHGHRVLCLLPSLCICCRSPRAGDMAPSAEAMLLKVRQGRSIFRYNRMKLATALAADDEVSMHSMCAHLHQA